MSTRSYVQYGVISGAYSIAIFDREIGEPSVEPAAAICSEREEIRARETVKDDITKGNGCAETEVIGAGWNGQPKF